LHLILGGAALQRCDPCIVLNAALAAEVKMQVAKGFFHSLSTKTFEEE